MELFEGTRGYPTYDFYKKKKNFLVAQEQKLGAMGHQLGIARAQRWRNYTNS